MTFFIWTIILARKWPKTLSWIFFWPKLNFPKIELFTKLKILLLMNHLDKN